jgi:hypothetical protein
MNNSEEFIDEQLQLISAVNIVDVRLITSILFDIFELEISAKKKEETSILYKQNSVITSSYHCFSIIVYRRTFIYVIVACRTAYIDICLFIIISRRFYRGRFNTV